MASISNMDVRDEGEYRVGTVPTGETGRIALEDNEVFEHFLVDLTNPDTRVKFRLVGRDWTVRNIGIDGVSDLRDTSGFATFGVVAHGDCLIENVYAGDGSQYSDGAGGSNTGLWLSSQSTGNLTIRGCDFSYWKDNGIYASSEHPGNLTIENCVAKDNYNANFRMGVQGRDTLRNSLSVLSTDGIGGGGGGRGLWSWYNTTVHVDNCEFHCEPGTAFWAGASSGPGSEIAVTNTSYKGKVAEPYGTVNFGSGVDQEINLDWIPNGVVTSAEGAARGETFSGGNEIPPIDGIDDLPEEAIAGFAMVSGALIYLYNKQRNGGS